MKSTIVGVDLVKNVIQVCVCTNNKMHSNTEMTPNEFIDWLANCASITIAFEAYGKRMGQT